jgi:predicted  nucleic acid-binding Zn-ribbon protein
VRAKARDERDELTGRLEAEVERMEASHTVALEEMKAELQAEYASDVEHLKETHKAAVERLKVQLEETERERLAEHEAALKAEEALAEAGSAAKDTESQAEAEMQRLRKELKAAQEAVEAARQEHEGERDKVKRAMAELKKKAERAERAQRKAETSAAELRGKFGAEAEVWFNIIFYHLPLTMKMTVEFRWNVFFVGQEGEREGEDYFIVGVVYIRRHYAMRS